MYKNDLREYIQYCKLSLYTNDTALYTPGKSEVDIMLNFRIELTVIDRWIRANKLTVNAKKTKYIFFGTKQQLKEKKDLRLEIGNEPLERVPVFKYLGVLIDKHITFNEHIDCVVGQASKKLGIFWKSREYLNRKTSVLLYKSLVLPHMDYCSLVYTCTNNLNLNRLQLVQNAACRAILQADYRESIQAMHTELNLPTIEERLSFQLSTECHKYSNIVNTCLSHMFMVKE